MSYYKIILDYLFIILFSPIIIVLFLLVCIYLLLFISRPIFFIQTRAGLNGKPFKLYKFRTMAINNNLNKGNFKDEKKRILKSTYYLRLFKLDELPQFLNIIKRDITLVGPRPLLLEYNEIYNQKQKKRLSILPGLTGWAQINGSNNISWKKKFELDNFYVENKNFFLDLKIIILTIKYILKKLISKSNSKEKIIGEKFNGSN